MKSKELIDSLESEDRIYLDIEDFLRTHYPLILKEFEDRNNKLMIYE